MSKSISSVHGTTRVGLLFYGVTAPYFARGAVKQLELKEPVGDSMRFHLVLDGTRVASSDDQGLLSMARDVPLKLRERSFERTALPYGDHEVDAANYLNLSPFRKVELEIEQVTQFTDGYVEQEWTQLVDDSSGLPCVRHVYNLVEEPEYVPPADAQQHAFSADERRALAAAE